MVVNILYYIMTIFVTLLLFLLFQEPYTLENIKKDLSIANIQMENVKDFEIHNDKISKIVTAKKSIKYSNKDLMEDFHLKMLEKDFIYDIKSDIAEQKNDTITLKKNVNIKRNDDTHFKSEKISYHKSDQKLICDRDFKLINPVYIASGKGFTYDLIKKSIIANKINVKYDLEKK